MTTTINRCTIHDLQQLIQISKKTFDETFRADNTAKNMETYLKTSFTEEKITAELQNPSSEFYFALLQNEVAGYLKVNVADAQTEEMGDESLEVERIYIAQAFQKQGIGKVLMNHAIQLAKEKNKKAIWLGVWEKNLNAIQFYERAGFVQKSSHAFYMGDEKQIDHIMVKKID
ncbi:MAG: GNAT family N-acetyltransferase [Kurthia sp.]|nr:GNAT family N-acetyltransferase [Candidatus Kurthia equi]